MTVVDDYIAAEIAKLQRVADAPTGALAFGRDWSCVRDIVRSPNGEIVEVDPNSTRAIGEAVVRRYITPRGSLIDDPDYGLYLVGYLNRGVERDKLYELSSLARAEALKDDRVADARVDVTLDAPGTTMTVTIAITPADPTLDDFSFTFAVTPAGIQLIEGL